MSVSTGIVAFVNLTETDVYQGKDTGAYNIVITLDDAEADKLEALGVKLKTFEGKSQRKFSTKFEEFKIVDMEGDTVARSSVHFGAEVKIQWKLGDVHPVHGAATYLQAIRVLDFGAQGSEEDEDF